MQTETSFGISSRFRELSRAYRQVAHVILTHPPLVPRTHIPKDVCPLPALDLHVLGTPPAFVLSQDQTLQRKLTFGIFKSIVALVQIRTGFLFAKKSLK